MSAMDTTSSVRLRLRPRYIIGKPVTARGCKATGLLRYSVRSSLLLSRPSCPLGHAVLLLYTLRPHHSTSISTSWEPYFHNRDAFRPGRATSHPSFWNQSKCQNSLQTDPLCRSTGRENLHHQLNKHVGPHDSARRRRIVCNRRGWLV